MKVNSLLLLWLMLSSCVVSLSCKKYLASGSGDGIAFTSTYDYDLLLNKVDLNMTPALILNMMTDEIIDHGNYPEALKLAYSWAEQLVDITNNKTPAIWTHCYSNIAVFNTVINGVDRAATGSPAEKSRLKAEALVGRAFEYLYLVNLYAKPYSKVTSGTDLAVPFVTSIDIADQVPVRATVRFIYEQIIQDLKSAIPYLPDHNPNKFRGSVSAAYSLLARAYFYTHDYEGAVKYANLTLQMNFIGLIDLNDNDEVKFDIRNSKQEIYTRLAHVAYRFSYYPDFKIFDWFSNGDLRLGFYPSSTEFLGWPSFSPSILENNCGTSVAEMKLIIAEAAVRENNLGLALKELNELRKSRITKTDYLPVESTNPEEILNWVLQERRTELAFKGLRWLDMRRLDAENRMPAVSHFDKNGKLVAELPPHSSKYILKIPEIVLRFNPGMPQN